MTVHDTIIPTPKKVRPNPVSYRYVENGGRDTYIGVEDERGTVTIIAEMVGGTYEQFFDLLHNAQKGIQP